MKCRFCGRESGRYVLCLGCNQKMEQGLLDKCVCGNYKGVEYDFCFECNEKAKREVAKRKKQINDNNIKGKLAEVIVEEMFLSMGYQVFRFGMENTVPGFGDRYIPRQGEVAEQVRKMPDFIIVRGSNIAFVEVKYRGDGKFNYNNYTQEKGGYPYKNAYFILVTPNSIQIQKASELEKGKKFKLLGNHPDFRTDRDIIIQYIDYCKKFFGKRPR